MAKTIYKKALPLFLVILMLFSIMPIAAHAESPDISIVPTSGIEDESTSSSPNSDVDISTTPNDGSSDSGGSSTPQTEPPSSESQEPGDESTSEGDESAVTPVDDPANGDEPDADAQGEDGISVEILSGNGLSRSIGVQATGNLTIHRYEAYQWDFSKGTGPVDMRPWYIMTIDGQLAYCVEPQNPDTTSGGYGTIDYNELNVTQQYSIGYAMLYGAQDMSNPLFHMATQVIIWEISLGYMDLSTFTCINKSAYDATIGHNPAAAGYYESILTQMRNHREVPSFTRFLQAAAPLHTMSGVSGEYKIDLVNTNPNCDLGDFNFTGSGPVSFVKENQTLHVTSTGQLDGATIYAAYKGANSRTNSLVFWTKGAEQVRATVGVLDPVPAYFRLVTDNIGQYKISIIKLESGTNSPLAGAEFEVRHSEKGVVGVYTTDGSGRLEVTVPWQGTYICTELTPPANHMLDDNPVKDVVISTDNPHVTLTFHNEPFSGIQITKVDATTKERIPGVTFRIARQGGSDFTDVTTGPSGIASLPNMKPDVYIVQEISCPPAYILDTQERLIEVRSGEVAAVTIENYAKPSLEITKVDADTGARLAGATFRVAKQGSKDYFDITTGPDGVARLTGMEPTYYIVTEIVSAEGYLLSDEEHTVEIVAGQVTHITITNSKKPALEILKIDSITKQPLQYATFRVSYKNGAALGNFTSDADGRIYLEGLEPQLVVIEEVSAPDGYIVSNGPQEMLLKPGQTHTVTFENIPKSPIIIKKIDSVTGEPLAGAKFRVTKMNGELIGEFTSGRYGYVTIPGQEPGWFTVVEILSPAGYKLNSAPINVEIKLNGDPAIVEFENTPLPGLLIRKVDAVTGLGMAGVEFEVEKLNGERVGTYTSGEGGTIFIEGITEKYLVIRETKTLPGYKIDTAEKLVELKEGELNTVEFENYPWPYLVIQKLDENKVPLPGAVFKISSLDGKEIGTYTTNEKGRIVLTGLDAQTVLVQEVKAPEGFALDNRVWEVELQWGMTTTITLKNVPLKIEVEVEKRGPVEAVAGQEIRYDFRNIANKSTVPLDDFYWSDILPTDAVRLTEIYTGTWNENLTYKVMYRTNLKDNWTVLADNLITSVNHQLVCSAQVLGLASNEYVTEFRFEFGTVKPGFQEVKQPFIMCRVLAELPDEYTFVNRTEVGGRYGGKWTYDRDAWVTVVFKNEEPRTLPKTGVWV